MTTSTTADEEERLADLCLLRLETCPGCGANILEDGWDYDHDARRIVPYHYYEEDQTILARMDKEWTEDTGDDDVFRCHRCDHPLPTNLTTILERLSSNAEDCW